MDLTISTLTLEAFLLVLVRTGCLLYVSPVFGDKAVSIRVRVMISFFVAWVLFNTIDYSLPEYTTVLDYSFLIIKEAIVGLSLGFVATLVMNVIVMAGEFIDREIGFTMSTNFDASTGAMVTITADLYGKLIYIIILVSNLHYFIIKALVQSFQFIGIGEANLASATLYSSIFNFIGQYFSIGFRIAMPVFLGMTMLNVILGVLSKAAPQMNMFVVGMQLKVVTGLMILTVTILFVPNIATYIMERIQDMMNALIGGFT